MQLYLIVMMTLKNEFNKSANITFYNKFQINYIFYKFQLLNFC